MSTTPWIKATKSADNNSCVEMRGNGDAVEVRDTKQHGAGPTLGFTKAQFAAWVDAAKRGELDVLG